MREEEIWKPIEGWKGLYQVSNMGRVKSLERIVRNGKNCCRTVPEKILKTSKDKDGYLSVYLCKDNKKKWYFVHRLVAQAFISNPDNLAEVNHKDKIRTNNYVDNLEWCTTQYNVEYSKSKAIIGINKISGLILEFPSAREASRQTDINNGNICSCLKGKIKSAGGYVWFYADED